MSVPFEISAATDEDVVHLEQLLPELADFDVPERRDPRDLWAGDLALAREVIAGERTDAFCEVARSSDDGAVLATILVSVRKDLLSGAPSAHLEAIAVSPRARGGGLGAQMLERAEQVARDAGAQSLSLHVFGRNERARGLYAKFGYDEELIRCVKWL